MCGWPSARCPPPTWHWQLRSRPIPAARRQLCRRFHCPRPTSPCPCCAALTRAHPPVRREQQRHVPPALTTGPQDQASAARPVDGSQHRLARGRGLQVWIVGSARPHRIGQGQKSGYAQHQGGLPHRFGFVDGISPVLAVPQRHVEDIWPVAAGGDFVGRGRMGAQPPLVVPDKLFGGEPPGALHIAPFDLTDIQRGVQRSPGIMQDVGAQDAVFTGQRVDHHFGHGGPIGEIEKRAALAFDAIPFNVWGFVKPGRRQADAGLMGHRGDLGKAVGSAARSHAAIVKHHLIRAALMQLCQMFSHAVANGVTGGLDGHPVQIGAR
mmetsp:Transcript_18455/g.30050  ORF Transcript_18455/g.30050 Transcript_18455/m.30050 type:complete len:323 (-) Transcript_18455:430-1398(-)